MSALRMLLVPAALLCANLYGSVASAATGGVIHFEGAIVESPCDVTIVSHQASVSCERAGQAKTQNFSLQKLTQEQRAYNNLLTMKMNYLNPRHTLAVVDVTYN